MDKLIALAAHLREKFRPEQVEAQAESGEGQGSFSQAEAGLLLFRHRYQATVELWGAGGDVRDLLAGVVLWLRDHAGRHDRFAGWNGTPLGDGRSDVTLSLELEEEVHYVPAAVDYAGPDRIDYEGQPWRRDAPTAELAMELAELTTVTG